MNHFIRFWLKPGLFLLLTAVMLLSAATGLTAQAAGPTPPDDPVTAAEIKPFPANFVLMLDNAENGLYTINTNTDEVFGPFLENKLGSEGGGLFDVTVTPDGKTAILSNFGDSNLFFVDISNPYDLTYIASLPVRFTTVDYFGKVSTRTMFAEDITMTADGKYALVTDGGFSPYIYVVDVENHSFANVFQSDHFNFQATDTAPDGTVIGVDYFGASITASVIDSDGSISETTPYQLFMTSDGRTSKVKWNNYYAPGRSVNAYVAPDGKTVLVPELTSLEERDPTFVLDPKKATPDHFPIQIYTIVSPGKLKYEGYVVLTRAVQSITFSEDGTKAYAVGNNGNFVIDPKIPLPKYPDEYAYIELDSISVLKLSGTGQVLVENENAALLYQHSTSQLFGVDVAAYANGKLIVGHPTISTTFRMPVGVVRVVDLSDFTTTFQPFPGAIISSTRALPLQKFFLPLIGK
ncbi:MAG TPA: hypothetical protein PKW33_17065 [Anaerolineaceae bacterium]|nr:hypothetical protein [Anaerolineaceae bacterium]HPN53310.1 hypothetical protein [Anaerolineaceae bacterium]